MTLFNHDLLSEFEKIIIAQVGDEAYQQRQQELDQVDVKNMGRDIHSLLTSMISNLRSSYSGGINVSDIDAAQLTNLDAFLQKLLNEKSVYNNIPIVSNLDPTTEGREDYTQYNNKYSVYLPGFNAYLQSLKTNLTASGDATFLPLVNNLIQQAQQAFGNKLGVQKIETKETKTDAKSVAKQQDLKTKQVDALNQNKELQTEAQKLLIVPLRPDGTIYLNQIIGFLESVKKYYQGIYQSLQQSGLKPEQFFTADYDTFITNLNTVIQHCQQFKTAYKLDRITINSSDPGMVIKFGDLLKNINPTISNQQIRAAAYSLSVIMRFLDDNVFTDFIELIQRHNDLGLGQQVAATFKQQKQIIDQKFGILPTIVDHYNKP